jgi:hypothetical protein
MNGSEGLPVPLLVAHSLWHSRGADLAQGGRGGGGGSTRMGDTINGDMFEHAMYMYCCAHRCPSVCRCVWWMLRAVRDSHGYHFSLCRALGAVTPSPPLSTKLSHTSATTMSTTTPPPRTHRCPSVCRCVWWMLRAVRDSLPPACPT